MINNTAYLVVNI